jgi:hypothetical protein
MSLSGQAQAEPAPPIVPSSRSMMVLGLGGQFLTSIGLLKVIPPIDRLLLSMSRTSIQVDPILDGHPAGQSCFFLDTNIVTN